MDLAEPELVAYCREQLAAYKCPRVYQFRSELPKNTLGKVLKDELVRAEEHRWARQPGPREKECCHDRIRYNGTGGSVAAAP